MDNETTVTTELKVEEAPKPKRTRKVNPQPNPAKELRALKKENKELKEQNTAVEEAYERLYEEYSRITDSRNEQNQLHTLKIKTVMDGLENLKRMLVIAEAGGN